MPATAAGLLVPGPAGIAVPLAGAVIDPVRRVATALITHAHSDHARAGHGTVIATAETLALMEARLGARFAGARQAVRCGEPFRLGDAVVTFFPAGHVLGSAQILIEAGGFRAVVSGDYKRQADPTCAPFRPVACDLFVTEATFALPVFRHPPVAGEIARLLQSRARFPGRAHVVAAYALGKTQRVIAELRAAGYGRPVFLHPAMMAMCAVYRAAGVDLGPLAERRGDDGADLAGEIVIAPPSGLSPQWAQGLADPLVAVASGWVRALSHARQRGAELPLVISDHAGWDELTATIAETGARAVWVTHGAPEALVHWCTARGIAACALPAGPARAPDADGPAADRDAA